ncbi:MAG: beta-ketoacyl-ACP synthase II [Firmicutes bacterium]|nr:beta-ketoacyl-ACP synthase II [Bacillota bacterium]
MKKRLVITGMGAVTPVGLNVKEYWEALKDGRTVIDKINKFDTENYSVKVAAEVKGFSAEDYMPKKLVRELDPFMQYAFAAADEALSDSGLEIEPGNTGIVLGTAMNGVTSIGEAQTELAEKGAPKRVSPRLVPKYIGNIGAAQIAIAKNITGPSMTVSTACSSGVDALTLAAMFIESGASDAMIAVGADSAITPVIVAALANAKALSTNPDPKTACRPFDLNRNGFVMGEGGGAVIIETEEHAKARGAKIYAELAGYANNTDGYHVTSPHPDGIGAVKCMTEALEKADMDKSEIKYINTHGTSTHSGDIIEVKAIKSTFGENAPLISSTKSATGHLMGAGGITETIACVMAVREGVIPPTLNYETPDPDCGLNCVPNAAVKTDVGAAMSNAFGFGGQNASVIVKRYEG